MEMAGAGLRPRVTIGLPVYNGARYLRTAIDSALDQSFENFELLIADNASTDDTQAICEDYAARDARVRYVRHEVNRGAFSNFQFVTAEARGDFITWLANDDFLLRDFVAEAVKFFKANPAAVLVMTDVVIIDENGVVTDMEHLRTIRFDIPWENRIRQFFTYPISNAYFCIYGVMRVDICQAVMSNLPEPRFVRGVELPILARLALRGELASLPVALRHYRRHSSSLYAEAEASAARSGRRIGSMLDIVRRAYWQFDHLRTAVKLEPRLRRIAIDEIVRSAATSVRNALGRLSKRSKHVAGGQSRI